MTVAPSGNRPRSAVSHRGSTTAWTLGAPAVVVLAAVAVALSWRSELPDPIATHWGLDGVDGFGPFGANLAAHALIVAAFSLALWGLAFFAGRDSLTRRLCNSTAVGFAVLFSTVLVGDLSVQRGLTDATEARDTGGVLIGAFVLATSVALVAAWATPADPPLPATAPVPDDAPMLALHDDEHVAWVQQVGQGGTMIIVVSSATLVLVLELGLGARMWAFAALFAAVVGLLLVVMVRWTVTVDGEGLTLRSLLRHPRIRVPLDEVVAAEQVQVSPLREFGGWGLRTGRAGRTGVIVQKGPALQVHRTGGRVFVVTVDDAATGAALLNTLAARARQG
jgi:hypothetical protein